MLARQPRPSARRVGVNAAAGDRAVARKARRPHPRDRLGRAETRARITRSTRCSLAPRSDFDASRDVSPTTLLLALFVGLDRRAEGHHPRAREPRCRRPSCTRSRCSAFARDDVVFSAAKLFFAYGLGNALTFPMAVGATAILMAERPTPAAVFKRLAREHQPTIFYGVPTLYAALLASADICRSSDDVALRVVHVGRRGAAGRTSASAGPSALRRRNPRRHRLDRDAAHLPVEPARRGSLRHDRRAGARLRAAAASDDDGTAGRAEARSASCTSQRADRRDRLLEQPRQEPRARSRARWTQQRRQVPCRHRTASTSTTAAAATTCSKVSGIYVSPVEVGGGADHASGRARSGGDRRARRRQARSSRRPTSC